MNVGHQRFRIGYLLAGGLIVLLTLGGCSSAQLLTRPIHTELTWFVGLDMYQEPETSKAVQYDHQAEWNELELATILSRLLVQQEMGWLDRRRPPVPVFTAEDNSRLTPILHTEFQQAKGSEWLSFVFLYPTGTNLEVTSGAFFIANRRLHVVIADNREVINQFAADIGLVRQTPCDPSGAFIDIRRSIRRSSLWKPSPLGQEARIIPSVSSCWTIEGFTR